MTARVSACSLMLFGLAATAAGAVCTDTPSCLRLLEERQRDTRALAARFEQTKHVSLMTEPLVTRGQFAFRRPDVVVWHIDDPPTTIRVDSGGVRVLNPSVSQADVDAVAPAGGVFRSLGGLFSGAVGGVQQDFAVEARADGDVLRVRLVPRRPEWQKVATAIEMTFTAPEYTIGTFRLDDPLGDRLEVRFFDVRRNDAVPASLFASDSPGR